MSATRWGHLTDAYNALAKGKKLIAMAQASMPASRPNEMSEANRNRIVAMLAQCQDAIAAGQAALDLEEAKS